VALLYRIYQLAALRCKRASVYVWG